MFTSLVQSAVPATRFVSDGRASPQIWLGFRDSRAAQGVRPRGWRRRPVKVGRVASRRQLAQPFGTMFGSNSRVPAVIALIGSLLGLVFSSYSTLDYAAHLDRRLHDVHCSFVPGAPPTAEAESCRAAMYSPYSAVLRDSLWGGIPISLFALGAFSFYAGFAMYLLLARSRASRTSVVFYAAVSVAPLLVSILMFFIAVTQLGSLCETCVGTYLASLLVTAGGLMGLPALREASASGAEARAKGQPALAIVWLGILGLFTLLPTVVYAATAPDHRPYLTQCGELKNIQDPQNSLVRYRGRRATQPALLFEDPLCPTCKALDDRMNVEGVLESLDITLVLMPLDTSCNWMLDQSLHPGACTVSKAVLCGKEQARQVLEWAFDNQEYLTRAGKQGEPTLRAVIQQRFGPSMLTCIDSRDTKVKLNRHLHFAADNGVPVSTPQVYLGRRKICDEDTDLGLRFALKQLAPEVLR